VVGVSEDVKLDGPHDPLGSGLLFMAAGPEELRNGRIVIRASEPGALIPAVRALVRSMDPAQPIRSLQTGRQAFGETVANPRFLLVILATFALVAVSLAGIGVYGLVSFVVAQRKREIGVRMALGARAGRVVAEVVGWGLALGCLGVVIGLGGAALLSRFVSALLFQVSPTDPAALLAASAVLMAACAAALLAPARRAAAVDPAEALRSE
jgi:ABC-type antimicrobial peptide transport system permease subunit